MLIEEDKEKGKQRSIGIISLWHVEQALLINRLLDEDPDISSRRDLHKIRCSDARGFQGDEKDVCLLSMVVGADEIRVSSTDTATYNVAVSRARFSVILFHSRSIDKLKQDDLRWKLLRYFERHSDLSPHVNQDLWGERFGDLCSLTSRLEGYTVKPIKMDRGLMIQVGSDCSKATCVFVVLGAGTVDEWKAEQEICYMLSRLDRTWKALWLFNAILRPAECEEEMRKFLKEKDVLPATNLAEGKPLSQGSRGDGGSGRGGDGEGGGGGKGEGVGGGGGAGGVGDQSNSEQMDPKENQGSKEKERHATHDSMHTDKKCIVDSEGEVLQDYEAKQGSEHDTAALHLDKKRKAEGKVVVVLDTMVDNSMEGPSKSSITLAKRTADLVLPAPSPAEQLAIVQGTRAFKSQHLACVLGAAFDNLRSTKELVAYVKTKSDVFKTGVPLSSKLDGAYNKVQIMESIAKCRPDGVTTAHELLSWLVLVSAAK